MSLKDAKIATRLPAQDLERARTWYAEKLGLHAIEERDGGLLYRIGDGERACWFRDSEGNMFGMGQPTRRSDLI
jgi:catechol-2,3-dioxygenase